MLMPDNGDSPRYVLDRIGDYAGVLTQQLGLGRHPAIGVAVLLLAAAGMVVGCIAPAAARRPAGRPHRAQRGDRQHPLPDGRPLLLPGPAVGPVLRRRRPSSPVPASCSGGRGPAAGPGSSPPCRCCSSSPCTSPCCPATSATPATSTRGGRQQIGPTDPSITPDLRRRASSTPSRRRHRLLPGPHDDAVHRPPDDPDDEHRPRPAAGRLLRPAALLRLLPAATSRRSRPRSSGSSRCGRTTAGSSGGCPSPDDVSRSVAERLLNPPRGRPVSPVASPRWTAIDRARTSASCCRCTTSGATCGPRSSASSRR